MKRINNIAWLVAFVCLFGAQLKASSHREAPLISNDPLADNVDLYAFRSPEKPNTVTLIATYVPLQLPHGGPNYYSFGENIRYEIHVDNDASVSGDEVLYRFTFTIVNEDPTTFFHIRLGKQNQKLTYKLERSVNNGVSFTTIVANGIVPPNNIGTRSVTGGAGLNSDYATLWKNSIATASTGERVFAGPVDDPFFVDLGGIFDLGDAPRQTGRPRDALACYNVSALAIEVPITTLLNKNAAPQPTNILDPNYVIGVWASSSRPAITTLSSTTDPSYSGNWVQVSRLGMPLTNEAVIPIGRKDFWNSITPYQELADTTLDQYFYNPELALYMDDAKFGGAVPAFKKLRIQKSSLRVFDFSNGADGVSILRNNDLRGTAFEQFGSLLLLPDRPRSVDLWPAFHTGVPNAIPYQLATGKSGDPLAAGKPFVHNFLPNGGDMLRLNMAVPVTPRNSANFSSEGLVQAAVLGLTTAPYNTNKNLEFIPNMDGFPNGRRLEDDVTRIELQAVGGVVLAAIGLWYDDFSPSSTGSPVTQDLLNVLTYTTGVEKNDLPFQSTFPYLALPHSGTGPCSGEIIIDAPEEALVDAQMFVSSNTQPNIALFNLLKDGDLSYDIFAARANDADGVYYDSKSDVLYQLNRTENVINVYSTVLASLRMGKTPTLKATSTSDFTNGREITVINNSTLIVAQDADGSNGMVNQFVTYWIGGGNIVLLNKYTVPINLWGMQITTDGTLYAVEDNSNRLAVFDKFLSNPAGNVNPTRKVAIDGIVRTHGITYDEQSDRMILTDIGDAASATDGGYTVIENYINAAADNVVSLTEQRRVAGAQTLLGNPVDVAYYPAMEMIYLAERASGGGRILKFPLNATGNVAPSANVAFPGASAVYLDNKGKLSTNTRRVKTSAGEIRAFPNPTVRQLTISLEGFDDNMQGARLTIFDATGREVRSMLVNQTTYEIDVQSFQNGMYIIKLQKGSTIATTKFMKVQ